jgi:hypothetical protein
LSFRTSTTAKQFAMNRQGGDDLEDDFVPDDLVAFGDDEGYFAVADSPSHLLSEEEESGEQAAELTKKQNSVEQKRKRKKEKEKEKKVKVGRFLLVLGWHFEVYCRRLNSPKITMWTHNHR